MLNARGWCLALALCATMTVLAAEQPREYSALAVGSVPFDELGQDIDGKSVKISEHHGTVPHHRGRAEDAAHHHPA